MNDAAMPQMPARGRVARRWLAAVIVAVVATLIAVGAFNAWVDPFQQYRIAERFSPRYYTSLHRFIVPGIVKNARYDTLLTGSSIVENTRNSVIAGLCGGEALNAAMPALTAYEQGLIMRTAFATHALRRVIVVVDFTGFNGAPDSRHPLAGPLPIYLYDGNRFNDAPYLLSWSVLVKSLRIVAGDTSERYRGDADAPWWWANEKRFARAEVVRSLDPADLNRQFPQPPLDLAQMQESFERNMLPVLTAHPEAEFDIVWPPYSIIVWADYVQRRQLDVTLAFKRFVFAATHELRNVRIVDLQPISEITHDLDNYTDLYHFSPRVNELLISAACTDAHRVRPDNVEALERQMRDQARSFDPTGLKAH